LGGTTIFRFLETLDEDAKIAGVYLLGVPTNPLGYPELEDFFKLPISVDAESQLRTDGYVDEVKAAAYLSFFFQSTT